MQPLLASIPTRSERQAMDWSLVLASQGIDATIDRDPQANAWYLLVDPPDYSRALQALRQYLSENKPRRWHQELPLTGLIVDWRSIVPMLFLVLLYAIDVTGRLPLTAAGLLNNQAVHAGEWWRLFTAVTLHQDLTHLAANTTTGLFLIGLTMGGFGAGLGLLAPFLAGVMGNLASLALYGPHHQSLGASGMVMGAIGLLAAQSLVLFRQGMTGRTLALRGIWSGVLLLVFLGFSPKENVNLIAHVGGFIAGLGLGAALAWTPPGWLQRPWTNRLALALCLLILFLPWFLALRAYL